MAEDLEAKIRIKAETEGEESIERLNKHFSWLMRLQFIFPAIINGFKSFAGAISGTVSIAADLEEQLSTVQAVWGANAETMERVRAVTEKLGAETRYTATEAAQGMETLARAGLNVEDAIATLPSVLSLAQGNAIGLGEAAGFITKAMRGMNLSAADAGHIADVLAKAAANANTDVTGLGQALSYAAPSANSLGVSLEETVAIIGKFADAGIDASRAGTALNSIMSQFSDPASKFRRELADIGITTNDFNEALHQLAEAGDEGSKAMLHFNQHRRRTLYAP